ncbi:transposase [Streptomyces sp. MUM 136J]|uniref:IS701 family transposase n=1 Tax=Streptomyces sp. MUM 136J TaxID=2791992 RepID=UPI001F045450|nr:transposase [Streptomyces sp. MUM 136J]MCH0569841.1 transposase [Streptomyces sp. MUM 136J]
MTAEQIAGWDGELSELTGSLGRLFNRPEPRVAFTQYVEGLLAELPKKNGWTLAERAGHVTQDRMQWLLNGSVWDADRLRDEVRSYLVKHLGEPEASLVIDDTQAQKKGTKSVGVGFQHCGLTGDVRNCQTMVMLTYAAEKGHAFIDRRLYPACELRGARRRTQQFLNGLELCVGPSRWLGHLALYPVRHGHRFFLPTVIRTRQLVLLKRYALGYASGLHSGDATGFWRLPSSIGRSALEWVQTGPGVGARSRR